MGIHLTKVYDTSQSLCQARMPSLVPCNGTFQAGRRMPENGTCFPDSNVHMLKMKPGYDTVSFS